MKKTKKAISLILAFAMVFTAMLGCMTIFASAAEGQADAAGPKLVDYSLHVDNTEPKTEAGSQIKVNLVFDKEMGSTNWTKSAFDILINDRSLKDMGFELKSVTPSGNNLVLVLQGIDNGEKSWAYVISGKFDLSLKSNYYEDIVDKDGNEVSEWTDIHTYVQTGLEFEQSSSVTGDADTPASVTFKLTGDAKLRGASPVQILVDGQSIVWTEKKINEDGEEETVGGGNCNEGRGTVNVHTHMYLMGNNTMWAKQLAGNFYSKNYTMTAEGDTVTITANENGENTALAENTSIRMFAYTEGDAVVQPVLFKEELAAAKERADEIADSNSVAQACKEALNTAIAQAEAIDPSEVSSAIEWQKVRGALKAAVDGAQDNAIATTSVTRSNGYVSLALQGGQDWIDNITAIKIGETPLVAGNDYETPIKNSLKIYSKCFDTEGETTPREKEYTITVDSEGYATVSQSVKVKYFGVNTFYLRVLDGKGNVKAEKSYSVEDLKDGAAEGYYNTACSMTGLRTFKGKGLYLEDMIEELKTENDGLTINPDTTMIKLRTNDRVTENDDPNTVIYYNNGQTTYNNLMQPRYWFPDLFEENSTLKTTVLENRANGINDTVRKALGESAAAGSNTVKPMLAYEYVEKVFVSDQNSIEADAYDDNLARDKRFRFLFGTKMEYDADGNIVSAAKETTTWMASYQVYGIDLVDASDNGSNVTFESNVADPQITVITGLGNGYPLTPNEDGTYSLIAGDPYKYTATKAGYKDIQGTITAGAEDETITLKFESSSTGGSSSSGGGSSAVTSYTVTFDANGGSSVAKQTVASGKTVSKPADPTREGYEFAGWYTDSKLTAAYDFGKTVTKSLTLYAKWTEKQPGTQPDPGTNPTTPAKFTDVASGSWYEEAVNYLADKGIVNGKTATTFEPNAQITRAEFVKIIAGVAGVDVSGLSTAKFSDVTSGSWYAPYIAWGVENGIINGVSDTQFNPNGNITRQDMAAIIKRYTDSAKFTLPENTAAVTFADDASIASYAKEAVSGMQKAGIINGKGENTFAPKDNATRAEASKMLMILMQQMGK